MKPRLIGHASVAALLFISSLLVNAQTINDVDVYEDEMSVIADAEAAQERIDDYQDDLSSLKAIITGASLYLSMDQIVSYSLPDGAGAPDYITLFGDTSDARLEPGAKGKALKFSLSDYITVANSAEIDVGSEDFSAFTWIRTSTTSPTLLDKRQSSGGLGYLLALYNGRVLVQLASAAGWENYVNNASPRVDDGQWHHIGFTIDRDSTSGGKLYVDGQVVHTFNPTRHLTSLSNTNSLFIGRHGFGSGSVSGVLDEVLITKRILSQSEVESLATTNGASVARTGAFDPGLKVTSTSADSISFSYTLPDPGRTNLTDLKLCFSTAISYQDNPCGDPLHEEHYLSYNSTKPTVYETYKGYQPGTTYYLGLTGKKTIPATGATSVERLSQTSGKTLQSSYKDKVWHTDVTATSAKINWTTSQGGIVQYLICWKKAGQAIGVCSNANENKWSFYTSQPEGSYTITGLIPGERYKIKVKVGANLDERNKVGTDKFTTSPAPHIDVWSQDITNTSITMLWTANSVYSKYDVCWKKHMSLRDVCYQSSAVYSPTTQKQITGLSSGKKYRVKVFGITSGGNRAMLSDDMIRTSK